MHVLHTFANNDSVPYLSWFAERAQREGGIRYSFLLLYPKPPAMMDEMHALGFDCTWIKYDHRHRKRGILKALPLLWWRILKAKPDIVHCHLFDDSLPGVIAAWLAGVKVRVATKQDTGFHWMHARRWVFLDQLITRLSTHVIAISGECRSFLIEKENAPPSKITLVHNGIPPERFTKQDPATIQRLRSHFGLTDQHPVIGTVARFIAWKGYEHIVDAARTTSENIRMRASYFAAWAHKK
ncbi:MAG: glycosyltransferase family 4 protein [Flavobacteriales bacterium]|nr:glycosyltransferase family 4 protein [Flavobacteriales bacterium]